MIVIKPPSSFSESIRPRLFLSGSIEMGRAMHWQSQMEEGLQDIPGTILNPRRDDWDSTWTQSINNPQFREQVEWEIEAQEIADRIVLYFDPNTQSPITLLELGLFCGPKLTVCCPDGFWRKGNVDIVCHRHKVEQVTSLSGLIERVREKLILGDTI